MALTEEQRAKLNAKAAMKASAQQNSAYQNEGRLQKVCPSCGQYVDADSIVCSVCGFHFVNAQSGGMVKYSNGYQRQQQGQPISYINIVNQQPVEAMKKHSSGMALAGMICSIVGLFILPWILSILGIIFGAIGWHQCKSYPEKYSGTGFGITGVVIGSVSIAYHIYLAMFVMNFVKNLFS